MLLMGGEVYHDSSRGPPVERRLLPETPEDLRSIVGSFFCTGGMQRQLLRYRIDANVM